MAIKIVLLLGLFDAILLYSVRFVGDWVGEVEEREGISVGGLSML